MKRVFFVVAMVLSLAGCGQASKAPQVKTDTGVESASAEVKTLQMEDGLKVTWLQDVGRKQARSIFADASDALVDSLGLQDGVPSTISAFLVEKDGVRMLFDAGLGRGKGRVLPLLDSLGVKTSEIDYLYLTHLHGDHIGGMMDGDKVEFPNATVWVSRMEYEGWMAMPDDRKAQVVKTFDAYKKQLRQFEFGDVLPCGVLPINAVGHTPGHTVYQLGQLLVIGDLIHGAALQLANPDICPSFDMDKTASTASRKRILAYARENGLLMAGMHLPAPAFLEPEGR